MRAQKLNIAVDEPLVVTFSQKFAVVDSAKYAGHAIATFAHKAHAKRFIKKSGYYPDRLSVHRIHTTKEPTPSVEVVRLRAEVDRLRLALTEASKR